MLRWGNGEGQRRQARGSEMWFKATGASTEGRFSLMERSLPPGGGAHRDRRRGVPRGRGDVRRRWRHFRPGAGG